MHPRWNTGLNDINNFLQVLDEILESVEIPETKRGRPTKHDKKTYLKLIITKEWKKRSLRSMETDYSELICNQRVDHSVIHYQEKTMPKTNTHSLMQLNSLHGIKAG